MELLNTSNITMKFGGLTAVKELNLEINKGEIVALIGPNGAGKTTAFNMITGVYAPTSGRIFLGESDITGAKPHLITKKGLARTFQNIRLFKELSVLDNVFIANHLHLKSNIFEAVLHLPRYKKEKKSILEKSLFLLEKLDLLSFKEDKAKNLPYGMQRRLEIARALATNPQILLLDEPAAGMNPRETDNLTSFIKDIRDEFELTIFLIEHHMSVVMGISDRIYVLDHGVTIAVGNPYEIQNDQRVIEAYLGVSEDA
ncbi:ABC transporter ATP-binding protein [Alkaliphilus peptidifermentans]|uniref:Amino acid/amide ABC transporter ATP-binding protein 1, HAAT family (TC 3.A.1.4.-) n=1 Tax=Alkaliphilus peptidifermentans DSM 18978 TaxID=1120976 RepID=A0A1G5JE41_9FIRM|nr:ABC transporter ATP-binding protein [Alkaliphilus peptidifermentans]SCY86527.1 amino acid/amide ABC transporter ATP-binding protein 1, HAAT family (TC 3.A.1.4.-) [Alkaliphilus peptidifermentans DSM 18978]